MSCHFPVPVTAQLCLCDYRIVMLGWRQLLTQRLPMSTPTICRYCRRHRNGLLTLNCRTGCWIRGFQSTRYSLLLLCCYCWCQKQHCCFAHCQYLLLSNVFAVIYSATFVSLVCAVAVLNFVPCPTCSHWEFRQH